MFGGYLIGLATWVLKYTFHNAKKQFFLTISVIFLLLKLYLTLHITITQLAFASRMDKF